MDITPIILVAVVAAVAIGYRYSRTVQAVVNYLDELEEKTQEKINRNKED